MILGYNSMMYHTNAMQPKRLSGNIFLVGMMGAGKTTVGKMLAQALGKVFVDSDEEIQLRTGVTIPHIFDIEGEESRVALCCNGIVVYLKSTIHDLWQRTRHDRNRPLLQTADPYTKLKSMYEQRDPLYAQVANLVMPTGKQSAQSLVFHLQQELNRFSETKS